MALAQRIAVTLPAGTRLADTIDRVRSARFPNCIIKTGCYSLYPQQSSALSMWTNAGRADYNAATFTVRKMLSRGFSYDFNYTLSVSKDNGGAPEPKAGATGGRSDLGGGAFADINNPDDVSIVSYGRGWAQVSNTPFAGFKADSAEGGIATPFIAHWPAGLRTPPGAIVDAPAYLIDLMPTLLDFLGVDVPLRLDGVSHYRLLTGATSEPPREYAVGVTTSDRSITDGHYRLVFAPNANATKLPSDNTDRVRWGNDVYDHVREHANSAGFREAYRFLDLADASLPRYDRPRFEFFDLDADPWELQDLAASPGSEKHVEVLREALVEWMDRTGDTGERP